MDKAAQNYNRQRSANQDAGGQSQKASHGSSTRPTASTSTWITVGERKYLNPNNEWHLVMLDIADLVQNYSKHPLTSDQYEYAARAISFVLSHLERDEHNTRVPDANWVLGKVAPQTTNQNSLDTATLNQIAFVLFQSSYEKLGMNDVAKVLSVYAWHQQQTTKEMLDLIGEDLELESRYDSDYKITEATVKTHNKVTRAVNDYKAELRASIQAREGQ